MTVIKISDLQLELKKELITNQEKVNVFLEEIQNLKKRVFDFSTQEGIKEAKELKTQANKFIKELKEFCEPLEADGKKVADARSKITTTLSTGKNNVIDEILAPVAEREEKIKAIKYKLYIPSLSAESNQEKINDLEALNGYEWLAFKDEALDLIERQKTFLAGEKLKFDEEKRLKLELEEKARIERENQIRLEAEARANAQAELRIKQETERLELEKQNAIRAEQVKAEAEKRKAEQESEAKRQADLKEIAEAERLAKNKEHQAKIHNEILEDFLNIFDRMTEEQGKAVIRLIAKGEIRNLKIIY